MAVNDFEKKNMLHKDVIRSFSDVIDVYDSVNSFILSLYEGEHAILDIGCGAGALARRIKALNPTASIHGIDISKKALEIAKDSIDCYFCIDLDLDSLPEFDTKFDLIILGDVIEHLKRPDTLLAELANHLTEGGNIILSVPNVAYWKIRLRLLLGSFDYTAGGVLDSSHLRFFTNTSISALISSSGYEIVAQRYALQKIPKFESLERVLESFRSLYNLMSVQFIFKIRKMGDR